MGSVFFSLILEKQGKDIGDYVFWRIVIIIVVVGVFFIILLVVYLIMKRTYQNKDVTTRMLPSIPVPDTLDESINGLTHYNY